MRQLLAFVLTVALALVLTFAISSAQIWNEDGDAGDLADTAQVPTGSGPLTQINGTFIGGGDADLYCISVDDPGVFRATTCAGTNADTQLWIFAVDGTGLSHNDDDPGGCGLQSTVTGTYLPGPGQYLIGISAYNWDPYNSDGELIWANSPYGDETPPDGPGAGNPIVASWGTSSSYSDPYSIFLTGANFCGTTATEGATWSALKGLYR